MAVQRTQDRLTALLNAATADFPQAWKKAEWAREEREAERLTDWPDFCYCPMFIWAAIVKNQLKNQPQQLHYIGMARLASLGAWRYTQSIYRVNEALYECLIETTPKGNLPVNVLLHMPEWCVYIETKGLQHDGVELNGFFAHLDWNPETQSPALEILLDKANGLFGLWFKLGNWTIKEAIEKAVKESSEVATANSEAYAKLFDKDFAIKQAEQLYPLISLLLYVCSDGVEYSGSDRPTNPSPTRTRRQGWKLFPASKPRVWNLGDEIGKTLEAGAVRQQGERGSPRPHIRRAHWHTFYAGKRDAEDRETRIKWIPPLMVAAPEDAINEAP